MSPRDKSLLKQDDAIAASLSYSDNVSDVTSEARNRKTILENLDDIRTLLREMKGTVKFEDAPVISLKDLYDLFIAASIAEIYVQNYTAPSDGITNITLDHTPIDPSDVRVSAFGGIDVVNDEISGDFHVTGNILYWHSTISIDTGDLLIIVYQYTP